MVNRKKKYTSGEGAQFMTRKSALKKLQLSLNDFRKLCILKGIYPREPRNRKRAQKGKAGIRTLYHVKDIQFLLHEPIVWRLRDYKIFNKKVGRARAVKDFEKLNKYLNNHPTLKLDHIVKERYPTFIEALKDLDDCLTLCFLFSTFPSLAHVPRDQSALCRRLTLEFLHAVIEGKLLRKVFVSIKGYYFQAEIKGQTITWIVPHHFSFTPMSKAEVDFKVMSTFVEFYTVMLGFVNFRLYHGLNLYYPPKFSCLQQNNEEKQLVDEDIFVAERVAALNLPVSKTSNELVEDDFEIDKFNADGSEANEEQQEEIRKELEKVKNLKNLFKGQKFYLNREVPREPLVFVIRCFGGEVSWDKTLFVGSTFDEDDETITHQIVDRPSMEKQFISRYYIQPQWVFDSVNARDLLPVQKYFMGEVLPPHLSPFIDPEKDQEYIPPEARALYNENELEEQFKNDENKKNDDDEDDDEEDDNEENEEQEGNDDQEDEEGEEDNEENVSKKPKLSVSTGEVYKEIPWEKSRQERQEFRLREKMIKNKHRHLYKSMMEGKQKRAKEIWLLRKKRRLHDEKEKGQKEKKKSEKPKKKIVTN
ncbi:unnamed protein product [Phyllotreta striolata]|uniref:Pescadillo homolog n=1 Tax=Phyllotreta striolata TaxID=444603 RepID=A0A9N9TUB8_PHYSR|nr:unnamed protein product [Phyllotreta striolata]